MSAEDPTSVWSDEAAGQFLRERETRAGVKDPPSKSSVGLIRGRSVHSLMALVLLEGVINREHEALASVSVAHVSSEDPEWVIVSQY